ncbi:hypothetical protein CEXT_339401 [Caerostris extrusa]|uniref:Uncharacterized protein n=1 Tax=Caerostris extrusa TaxID=172846 RepID=A0AAV4TPU5_CAEEX|nr:hypothetical protein CEXT_339401 [Caerostris extrusa]
MIRKEACFPANRLCKPINQALVVMSHLQRCPPPLCHVTLIIHRDSLFPGMLRDQSEMSKRLFQWCATEPRAHFEMPVHLLQKCVVR